MAEFLDPTDITEIFTNQLYISNYQTAKNKELVKNLGINTIINVAMELDHDYDNIKVYKYHLDDKHHFKITNFLDKIADLINEKINSGHMVLIHCMAGKSRSATFILAYLMKYKGMNLDEAYKFFYEKRQIFPNNGFIRELVEFDKKLFTESKFNLHKYDRDLIKLYKERGRVNCELIKEIFQHIEGDEVEKIYYGDS